ncbi:hypothetical protein KGM_203752 [Danaus plexippus plexippus]|uniref:Uncharacterized protein n=1 Tax=Danaus plexippus plexippus TaxID=278856 RepID=A0A212FIJ8_DANPL|nr:hypothetical protein KGM_203752 [Danaus plexippus plexippus]
MWHYPRWKRLQETDKRRKLYKDHEYTYMAEMAFVHAILTIVVKEVFFFKNYWESLNDYMGPFGRMNNMLSSTLDEICLSVVVMTILEHVIFRLFDLFKRQTAYELLLTHRRPLLINNSGPGFWKILFLITAHIAPYFNITVLLFQSWHFHRTYIRIRKFLYRSGIFTLQKTIKFSVKLLQECRNI